MVDIKYANAFVEVLDIIFNLSESEYNKIPSKFIELLEENSNTEYEFIYDPNKTLDEQNVSLEAKAIIAVICRDFLASEEEKNEIIQKEKDELQEYEKMQREKYNPEQLFYNDNNSNIEEQNNEETSIVEYKEPFFVKIKNIIKDFINKFK